MKSWHLIIFSLYFNAGEEKAYKHKQPFIFHFDSDENITEPVFQELKHYIQNDSNVRYILSKEGVSLHGYSLSVFRMEDEPEKVTELHAKEREIQSFLRLFFDASADGKKIEKQEDPVLKLVVQEAIETGESVV